MRSAGFGWKVGRLWDNKKAISYTIKIVDAD
jgi:hypothetical protein